MAKDEEKETEETKQETEEPQETKKKKLPFKILIPAILILFLLGGGAFAWKRGLLDPFLGENEKGAVGMNAQENERVREIGPIYGLQPFVVNLMEPLGRRYLKTEIKLELNNEKLRPEIEKRLPQFRDAILTLLSSKSYNDIRDLPGKFKLRAEIIAMLNGYLKHGRIENLYFTEFIVQ